MKTLSHSQRATMYHLGMTEEEYVEHDRLIDLGRDTLLDLLDTLVPVINELDIIGGAMGNKRPGRFSAALDVVLDAVKDGLRCGDCGVHPGDLHRQGCDIYRCKVCGLQGWVCHHRDNLTRWTGLYPGTMEEREYDLLDLNMVATFQSMGNLIWDSDDEVLKRNPAVSDADWSQAKADYIKREIEMSARIFAEGWFDK